MRKSGENIFANIDWTIMAMWFGLMILGWINLYSASYNESHPSMFDLSQEYGKQFMWICVCLVLATTIVIVDSAFYVKYAYHIYGVFILMLVAVLIVGAEKNGAKSWFGVGSFGIQPSEFAKFATALMLAKYLSAINIKMEEVETRFIAVVIIAIPAGLILLQPDAGTCLVFASFILVLYREGLSGNILLLSLLGAIISVLSLLLKESEMSFFAWMVPGQFILGGILLLIGILGSLIIRNMIFRRYRKKAYGYLLGTVGGSILLIFVVNWAFESLLQDHQRVRIEILLGLKVDKDQGYNVHQAMAAIGSGGWIGKGYRQGTLSNNKYKHVPMQSTDFIFCSVGEEWGFVGTTFLILLFVVFMIRIIMVAERQRSKFTRIYGYAVASIIFFHVMINIGMAIGLAPVIGIPLPFFSYGGSSLIGFTMLLMIFVKLDSDRLEVLR